MRAGFKTYSVDTGLRNRVAFSFSKNSGKLVENIVFCHLKRLYDEIYYYSNGGEIDFVVKEGIKITKRIQVWYDDISIETIPERELKCFDKPVENNDEYECILITNNYERIIKNKSKTIQCIPITKYLLL
ncbi:MAG: ATPase [Candidatus Magnetoglobus multicellularis str. Araruama]|uniref:ATPase n=1 Tax=Candidatus Magnetoglobus multicellularis str. Araruama TaxID=890399 RepID=A0A1V1P6K9_9BACT|nr:MAG: ATPase [Candidatus Magnetoglobus multicellularis str. Araruama]